MNRSRKKTPISGITTASSEKHDKRLANRKLRRRVNQTPAVRPDAEVLPALREVSDPRTMAKDGKYWRDPLRFPRVLSHLAFWSADCSFWGVFPSRDPSMAESKVKERVIDAVRALPEDATVEDAMERLYFLAKVDEGIRQADAGQTVSHDEARRRILD